MIDFDELTADEQIQRDVLDELHFDAAVRPTEVGIQVTDGVVTLAGIVHSYHKRRAAADAVLRVRGVRGLVNELIVQTLPHGFPDEEIARRAVQALEWNSGIPEHHVRIQVSDGWVTLQGAVEDFSQKQAAEEIVEDLDGVHGVTNRLEIRPDPHASIAPEDLIRQIEHAFVRNAEVDAHRIKVAAHGSVMTLRGTVRSWSEQREAVRTAWTMPGVKVVEDKLRIAP